MDVSYTMNKDFARPEYEDKTERISATSIPEIDATAIRQAKKDKTAQEKRQLAIAANRRLLEIEQEKQALENALVIESKEDDTNELLRQLINKQLVDQEPPLRGQRKSKPKRKRAKNPDSSYSYRRKRKLKKDRKKRAPTKWVRALKELNKNNQSFCIPKKGTEEYQQVLALMAQM